MIKRRDDTARADPGLRDLLAALEASAEASPLSTVTAAQPPQLPAPAKPPLTSPKAEPTATPLALPASIPEAPKVRAPPVEGPAEMPLHEVAIGATTAPPAQELPPTAAEVASAAQMAAFTSQLSQALQLQPVPPLTTTASTPLFTRHDAQSPQPQSQPLAPLFSKPLLPPRETQFPPRELPTPASTSAASALQARPAIEKPDEQGSERRLIVSFGVIMALAVTCAGAALFWQSADTDPPVSPVSALAPQDRTADVVKAAPTNTVTVRIQSIADAANLTPSVKPLPGPQAAPDSPPVPLTPSVGMADLVASHPVRALPLVLSVDRGPLAGHSRVRLRGLPAGAQLSHGQVVGDDWWLTSADLGQLSLTLPPEATGRWRLTFEVVARDNPHISATSATLEVKSPVVATLTPPAAALPELRKGEDEDRAQKYLRRGQQLLGEGDVAAARTFFRMAAEAGDAEAAMAMGATHDPNHLQQFGVRGMQPDPAEAERWYRLALNLGSKDALDRIDALHGRKP